MRTDPPFRFNPKWVQKKITMLAPDALIFVQGKDKLTLCARCGRSQDIMDDVTSISMNNGINLGGPGSATVEIMAPRHKEKVYFNRGRPVFTPMQEVEIYLRGRFLDSNGTFPYYPAFWGMISSVNASYNDGFHSITLNCVDMLRWWELHTIATKASVMGAANTVPGVTSTPFENIFQGMNPWQVILFLANITAWSLPTNENIYANQGGAFENRDSNMDLYGETGMELLKYWKLRFGQISRMLRIVGPTGIYGQDSRRLFAYAQQDNRASANVSDETVPKVALDDDVLSSLSPNMSLQNMGFELASSQHANALSIAKEMAGFISYEFFQDINGEIMFKPALYNLDVRRGTGGEPALILKDEDIIAFSLTDDENSINATRVDVTGEHVRELPGIPQHIKPKASFMDPMMVRSFGMRVVAENRNFINSPDGALFYAINEVSKQNVSRITASFTIPIRPEIRLGFPIYYADERMYCYINSYNMNLSFEGNSATMGLTAVGCRRQILTEDFVVRASGSQGQRSIISLPVDDPVLKKNLDEIITDLGGHSFSGVDMPKLVWIGIFSVTGGSMDFSANITAENQNPQTSAENRANEASTVFGRPSASQEAALAAGSGPVRDGIGTGGSTSSNPFIQTYNYGLNDRSNLSQANNFGNFSSATSVGTNPTVGSNASPMDQASAVDRTAVINNRPVSNQLAEVNKITGSFALANRFKLMTEDKAIQTGLIPSSGIGNAAWVSPYQMGATTSDGTAVTDRFIVAVPFTDEAGYEVFGGLPYGRGFILEDGNLILKTFNVDGDINAAVVNQITNAPPSSSDPGGGSSVGTGSSSETYPGSSVDQAARLLREFEGFKTKPYWDVNHWRIGFGSDEITRADGTVEKVCPGKGRNDACNLTITEEDAERDLRRRIPKFQSTIISQIGRDKWDRLPPYTQAALTSFAYNYGSLTDDVKAAAISGDNNAIADAIYARRTDNGGVNAKRRGREAGYIRGGATGSTSATTTTSTTTGSLSTGLVRDVSAITPGQALHGPVTTAVSSSETLSQELRDAIKVGFRDGGATAQLIALVDHPKFARWINHISGGDPARVSGKISAVNFSRGGVENADDCRNRGGEVRNNVAFLPCDGLFQVSRAWGPNKNGEFSKKAPAPMGNAYSQAKDLIASKSFSINEVKIVKWYQAIVAGTYKGWS